MGIYLNPGNSGFAGIRNDVYVDKSGLIALINETIDTPRRLTCVSRPRRFGKSFAAKMLCAYYDKTCDSSALFDNLMIAGDKGNDGGYRRHLNRYDVIYLDMTNVCGKVVPQDITSFIQRSVTEELFRAYPDMKAGNAFDETLLHAAELTGNKFIMIIDEWDAPIREIPEVQKTYLQFLRTLFKGSGTTDKIFAAVYMTGILPIKKDGSQSAISDFKEFSMVKPRKFGGYVGFTEEEVLKLCEDHHSDFKRMKQWYDGYTFRDVGSVYNPNSVMEAIRNEDFDSYWTQTSAAESLMGYISQDFDGLSLTVAAQIEKIHAEEASLHYNNEQSLCSVIKRAYVSCGDEFVLFEELPGGDGFADIVYLPKKDSLMPALVIELKWNKTAEGAIAQMKDRRYPDAIRKFGSEILLVGINYDKDAPAGKRKHTCLIEKYQE